MSPRGILAPVVAVLLAALSGPGRAGPGRGADVGDRAEALLYGATVNRFVAKQLPIAFQLPGDRDAGIDPGGFSIVDARYCGSIDAERGRLRGVVRPAGSPAQPLLGGVEDCRDKVDEVARRAALAAGGGPLAVIEIVAAWAPAQLRVSIREVATAGEGAGALRGALARAKAAGPLATIDTAGLRLAAAGGASLSMDLAISFPRASDAVLATLTPSGHEAARPARAQLLEESGAPAGTDGIAGASLSLANRLIALYSQDGPLMLEVGRDQVEIRSLELSGGNGAVTLKGRATSRSLSESLGIAIDAAGADLKVSEIRADPEVEDCGGASMMAAVGCRARNAARAAAAAAFAGGMNARYRGEPLRALIAPPPFSFEMAGRRLTLRLTPLRATASGGGVTVCGRAELE